METTFKKVLSQIKADDELKKRTAEYVLNADSNIVSINSAAAIKKKPFLAKRLVAAACIAAVLCALPIGAYAYYKTPTSYISVDINPSVELGINAFGKVVTVKAYNTDGETIISGLQLVNSNVESAVRLIVKSASQNGFIKDDGSSFISVTAETNNEKKAEALIQDAQTGAEEAITAEDDQATILSDNTALNRRDEALALGITPGKLNLIQKLQELDPTIQTDDYKGASVSDIQKKYTELKKEQNNKNGKDDKDDKNDIDVTVSSDPNPSPGTSPAASPAVTPSPSVSPDASAKPGNGNHNGNGNKKPDESSADPSADEDETGEAGSSPSAGSDSGGNTTHGNSGSQGHSNNGNGKN